MAPRRPSCRCPTPLTEAACSAVNIYVYYRVDVRRSSELAPALRAVQARLTEAWGVNSALFRRSGDPSTWMETYEEVEDPQGFLAALALALDKLGFDGYLAEGTCRHVESFEACV